MDMTTFLDTYTMETLTASVNAIPEVPSVLSPYFGGEGIRTTIAAIDLEKEHLTLVSDSPRGGHGPETPTASARNTITIPAAHLLATDAVFADEIQNVRAFGKTELETLDGVVLKKQARMRRNLAATLEYHRVGAVKGKVMDADGVTVLHDIHKLFGLTANPVEEVAWPDATGKVNVLKQQFDDLTDRVELGMGGVPFDGVCAIVGKTFWEYLTTNPLVREAYNLWAARQSAFGELGKAQPFEYGGIRWIRYNKIVAGTTLVAADEAHVFPIGADVLKHFYAPADYVDTVNTYGQQYYSMAEEMPMRKGISMEVQSNPITLCMFPQSLFTLKSKAA